MKVKVDEERCAGHGMCLTLCPEVFEMTHDGWTVADPEEVPPDLVNAVRDSIQNCPEQAISETD